MKKLLIVEDHLDVRRALAAVLRGHDYEVTEEGTVAGAISQLTTNDFSAIILDLRLPNGHGRRVIESLTQKRNDIPVVILSAYPDEVLHEWPVTSILKKPTKRLDLIDAVRKAEELANSMSSLRYSTTKLRDLNEKPNEGSTE